MVQVAEYVGGKVRQQRPATRMNPSAIAITNHRRRLMTFQACNPAQRRRYVISLKKEKMDLNVIGAMPPDKMGSGAILMVKCGAANDEDHRPPLETSTGFESSVQRTRGIGTETPGGDSGALACEAA